MDLQAAVNKSTHVIDPSGALDKTSLPDHVNVLSPDPDALPARLTTEDRVLLVLKKGTKRPNALIEALLEKTVLGTVAEMTLLNVAERCSINSIKNLSRLTDAKLATAPMTADGSPPLTGVPAFIVGAGPSLDRNKQHLKAAAERGLIIAVDASAPAVRAAGVDPDVVVTLESKHVSKMMTYNQTEPYRIFACDITANPANWEIPAHRKIAFSNIDPAYSVHLKALGAPPLSFGGCVSTAALSLAYYWGCGPIILLGQDFAYTDGKAYCEDMLYSEQTIERILVPPSQGRDLIRFHGCPERGRDIDVTAVDVPGWCGTTALTTHEMLVYRDWIGRIAKRLKTPVINATEGGVHIPFCPELTAEEVIRNLGRHTPMYSERIDFFDLIDEMSPSQAGDITDLQTSLRDITYEVEALIAETQEGGEWDSYYRLGDAIKKTPLFDAWMYHWVHSMKGGDTVLTLREAIETRQDELLRACRDIRSALDWKGGE